MRRGTYWINCFAIGLTMSLGLMSAARSEFKLGGKNASDFFVEPQLAALARAAEDGRIVEIERLVKSGVPIEGLSNWANMTPLVWALTARSYSGTRALGFIRHFSILCWIAIVDRLSLECDHR